jgi:hypothetical protein
VPAHVGCAVGPDGSRRIQKDHRDDHWYRREEVDNEVSRRTWTGQGRSQGLLDITQGGAAVARLGDRPVVLMRTTVHGVTATVWKSRGFNDSICLSWAEGAIGFRICNLGSPAAPLSPAELVKIGEGLR